MAQHRFKSILEEYGSLENYLNEPKQRQLHNTYGYDMWKAWHNLKPKPLTVGALARLFNVSTKTIRNWEDMDKEQGK